MKVFLLLLLLANLVYGGWHLFIGHPTPLAEPAPRESGGERLELLSER